VITGRKEQLTKLWSSSTDCVDQLDRSQASQHTQRDVKSHLVSGRHFLRTPSALAPVRLDSLSKGPAEGGGGLTASPFSDMS
jgi:hypothetical protein